MITNIIVQHSGGGETMLALRDGFVSIGDPQRGARPLDQQEARVIACIVMALADNYGQAE